MANLTKYRPRSLALRDSFFRELDTMMDRFFGDMDGFGTPTVDIREEDDRFVLEAELPGMTEKDIDVNITDDVLTISSEKKDESEEKKEGYLLRERRHSSFSRSFVLPRNVDREHIDAGFKNGILTLKLPKSEESKPKRIDIKLK